MFRTICIKKKKNRNDPVFFIHLRRHTWQGVGRRESQRWFGVLFYLIRDSLPDFELWQR